MSSPFINITIPVFNEERQLAESVCKLHRFLAEHCQFRFEIVIANNGSTDRTQEVSPIGGTRGLLAGKGSRESGKKDLD